MQDRCLLTHGKKNKNKAVAQDELDFVVSFIGIRIEQVSNGK
jgi:hypothetical protein